MTFSRTLLPAVSCFAVRRIQICLVLLLLGTVGIVRADNGPKDGGQQAGHGPTLASVESSYYGYAALANPKKGTFEDDLEISMIVTSARAGLPLPFHDNKVIFSNTLVFSQTHLEYRNWDYSVSPRNDQPRDFYSAGWETTLATELVDWAWLITQLNWGLYSDLEKIDENDDRLYGMVLADFSVQNGMNLGVGVSYNSDFGYPTPIPIFRFAYSARWFRTDLTIPSQCEIYFIPHERVEIGAKGRLIGNEYRMTYQNNHKLDNLLVQASTIDLGAALNLRLFAGLWLNLFGGASVNNRYKSVLANGDELRDISVRETWFVQAGLAYKL